MPEFNGHLPGRCRRKDDQQEMARKATSSRSGTIMPELVMAIAGFFFVALILGVFVSGNAKVDGEWKKYSMDRIVSMRSDTTVEGRFALGFGKIRGTEYILCFRKDDEGNMQRARYPMDKVLIKEDDSIPPQVVTEVLEVVDPPWYSSRSTGDILDTRYALTVPIGTVSRRMAIE